MHLDTIPYDICYAIPNLNQDQDFVSTDFIPYPQFEAPECFTETQNELVQRFDSAFFEAQNREADYRQAENYREPYQDGTENFLLDVFLSKELNDPDDKKSVFYVQPPFRQFDAEAGNRDFDDLQINLCDDLSNGAFDIDTIATDFDNCLDNLSETYEEESLEPSIGSFEDDFGGRQLLQLDNFLRNSDHDTINLFAQEQRGKSCYGHLLGTNPVNNNIQETNEFAPHEFNYNHIVLPQDEAILHDDVLLSTSSMIFPSYEKLEPQELDAEDETPTSLQCKWEGCYEIYADQKSLVRHIEKNHVELKKGDEFSCFWLNCPRKSKPFNARYKLLIHMRVHSGEKPNRCPFKGCNKAFSRLENLKIHQRSHTGERPYLCQFSQCTKSFSNSSDRAKHQRTHFDTKPYACQIMGCQKRYTDPSSLRKHVKNHTAAEQAQLKRKQLEREPQVPDARRKFRVNCATAGHGHFQRLQFADTSAAEHSYSSTEQARSNVKIDLRVKISEKRQRKSQNL